MRSESGMRVSQEEKDKSHRRIVDSAARLMRERGIEAMGVSDVMVDAGLTHGGFYRHFQSKESLTEAALQVAIEQAIAEFEVNLEREDPKEAATVYLSRYLSIGHLENPGIGCPLAALGGRAVNRMIAALTKTAKGRKATAREAAIQEMAMLVGAVVISRASDPATAREVISACRRGIALDA